jgi:hypothetical protein
MHCTYGEVLDADPKVVFLYMQLMAAEAEVERQDRQKARKTRRKR